MTATVERAGFLDWRARYDTGEGMGTETMHLTRWGAVWAAHRWRKSHEGSA